MRFRPKLRIIFVAIFFGVAPIVAAQQEVGNANKPTRPLRIDDLHQLEFVTNPEALSEDGALAIVRGGSKNSVTNELIGAVTDIWVQERPGDTLVNITNGSSDNSIWTSPLWSPDGKYLLMRSTRGGLGTMPWLWDRKTKKLQRLIGRPLPSDHALGWIGSQRVLCTVLSAKAGDRPDPAYEGDTEAWRLMKEGWARMVKGVEPSANVLNSPAGQNQVANAGTQLNSVDLLAIDAATLAITPVVTSLTPSIDWDKGIYSAPDGRHVAVVRQDKTDTAPGAGKAWDSRYGIQSIQIYRLDGGAGGGLVRFDKPLPSDIVNATPRWSPDGRALAFFAYGASRTASPRLWRISVDDNRAESFDIGDLDITPSSVGVHPNYLFVELEWAAPGEVIFKATQGNKNQQGRFDWWLLDREGKIHNLTSGSALVPAVFNQVGGRTGKSVLVAVDKGNLWRVDAAGRKVINLTKTLDPVLHERVNSNTPQSISFAWPRTRHDSRVATEPFTADDQDQRGDGTHLILTVAEDNSRPRSYFMYDLVSVESLLLDKPAADAMLAAFSSRANTASFVTRGSRGAFVWRKVISEKQSEQVLAINTFVSEIRGGEFLSIAYVGLNGEKLTGSVLLPVAYEKGKRYPLITVVYPSSRVNSPPFFSSLLSRAVQFNFQIAAAGGFAVLFPSTPPFAEDYPAGKGSLFLEATTGVLPAVSKVVDLGVADPDRLFLLGHSMGGYQTYAIIEQTSLFKAAIGEMGPTNLISWWGTYHPQTRYGNDPLAMFAMTGEENQLRLRGATPSEDLGLYFRNSPSFFADRIQTPVMIVDADMNGLPFQQSEDFFKALYVQGKRAQFVRYWGEGHIILARANQRDLWRRTFAWFDEFGDIARDSRGNMIFAGDSVRSREGAAPLKPEDYERFDVFQPTPR